MADSSEAQKSENKTKVGNAAEDGQKDDAVAQKATTHDLEAFAADFCGVTDPNDKIFG